MAKHSLFFFLVLLELSLTCTGQVDTVQTLAAIEIKASKIRQMPIGSPTQEWTTQGLQSSMATNLAQLLSEETGTYIKNYGLGSLSTSSIRGASAAHTLVLWNGLPLQSPMLGLLDLSFLATNTAETITFQKGGNAALWGSGAIGGVIGLNNEADYTTQFSINNQTTTGSFGYFQQLVAIGLGRRKFQLKTRYSYQKARNDFSYFVAPNLPKRKQSNAHFSQQHIFQDLYWKINTKEQISFHFWRQDHQQAIPPTAVQTRSAAHQEDWSNRFILHWKKIAHKVVWQIKTGFFDEYQDYTNELSGLSTHNHFRTLLGEITRQWTSKKEQKFYIGGTHSYIKAWSKGYAQSPVENKSSLFVSWRWEPTSWQWQASLRYELVNNVWIPFMPSIGLNYQLNTALQLQAKISKNYRLPTLNDRFWRPGGNEDLLPESGWSQEATFIYQSQKDGVHFKGSLTGFNRTIDNWILWTLRQGASFWSAHNLTKVWSKGIEPRLAFNYSLGYWQLSCNLGYDYILSTNQVALERPRLAKGEQLLYSPIHQANGKIALDWKGIHLAYQHHWKGATKGINEAIAPYQIGNLRLQYNKNIQNYQGSMFFTINNIWNRHYYIIERRPMPGTHFQLGINLIVAQFIENANN